jgi:hypothetical protein
MVIGEGGHQREQDLRGRGNSKMPRHIYTRVTSVTIYMHHLSRRTSKSAGAVCGRC